MGGDDGFGVFNLIQTETMTKTFAFAPIRNAYRIRQVAADSWWVYLHNICSNGELSQTSRVVFFGNSREQVDQWIESKNEFVFVLPES